MKRILVAYDGGEPARKALATAIELAKAQQASIAVVSVVPVRPGRAPMDPWDDGGVHAAELVEARKIVEESGVKAEFLEPFGEPAATIELVAKKGDYDTIVVGSRGLGLVARFFQGSVSADIAAHTDRTVVIVR